MDQASVPPNKAVVFGQYQKVPQNIQNQGSHGGSAEILLQIPPASPHVINYILVAKHLETTAVDYNMLQSGTFGLLWE